VTADGMSCTALSENAALLFKIGFGWHFARRWIQRTTQPVPLPAEILPGRQGFTDDPGGPSVPVLVERRRTREQVRTATSATDITS
jgi:hypothetical protein